MIRQKSLSPACDVYSYAMVLYEVIFRVEPFAKDSPEVGWAYARPLRMVQYEHSLKQYRVADFAASHP